MKQKRFFCALCALMLLACLLCAPAAAEETEYFIYDIPDVLTGEQVVELNDAAKEVSLRHGCGVYVAVFDDMAEYGYQDIEAFAQAVVGQWELGVGAENNAVTLVISKADGKYCIHAQGATAQAAFPDNKKEALADAFTDNLSSEDWAGGFSDFIKECDAALSGAPAAEPSGSKAAEGETETFVYDIAGLLTDAQASELNKAAKEVSLRHGCGVYIALFEDMTEYGYQYIETFSEAVYDQWSLGIGADRNCIILVMSMADRDYDLCAHGDAAHTAFTDYGKEVLADAFKDDFRHNDWASGFADYVSQCDYMLSRAAEGDPIDIPEGGGYVQHTLPERIARSVIPGLIIGVIIAFIYCAVLKSKMKNTKIAHEASEYIAPKGIAMHVQDDVFTHSTVTRQHIERDNDRGGGHGGTSVNSGGFSHSSGKF